MRNLHSFLAAAIFCLGCGGFVFAQDGNALTHPTVSKAVAFVITSPLRELAKGRQEIPFGYREADTTRDPKPPIFRRGQGKDDRFTIRDPVAQNTAAGDSVPTKLLDWLGLGQGFYGYDVHITPSDMNLSIGDTQIIQWGNNQFTVFDLNGNNLLFDDKNYVNGNILFSGLPNCGVRNDGDAVAQWDKIAHRWVMIEPVMANPGRDCIAISQTPDALGSWYAYEFAVPNADTDVSDYGKLGVWPDAYYTSHNDVGNQGFRGTTPCAYERLKLLAGDPAAQQVCFFDTTQGDRISSFDDNQLPSDLDSPNSLPPNGMPNIYMGSISNTSTGYVSDVYYYKFHVDWANPANSTFSCINGACAIPVAQFKLGSWLGSLEPGGSQLQTLANRLMYRLAYRVLPSPMVGSTVRNPGTTQSWVVSHAVGVNGRLGIRWYEFRAPLGSTDPVVYQQGTYSPDATWRFMSSIAMDKMGNMAMSYTVTDGDSVYPTIAFTGRGKDDPLGTMGAEQHVIDGTGSQIDSNNHWGDYYNMSLSNDGCTFVTTGQYYTANASYAWSTRVVKLKFDNCIS